MKLKNKKMLVKSLYNVGNKRIKFDSEKLSEIKEAITKKDIKGLVNKKIIIIKQKKGSSRVRARKILIQKKNYRELYLRAKGGFFRSRKHLKTYINERGLILKDGKK